MEKAFEHAHFIWPAGLSGEDSYAEFLTSFEAPEEKAVCRISCDGDYTLFLNGEAVGCNQYGDFEYYKISLSEKRQKHARRAGLAFRFPQSALPSRRARSHF